MDLVRMVKGRSYRVVYDLFSGQGREIIILVDEEERPEANSKQ